MVSFRINIEACDGKKLKQVFLQIFSLSPALAHRLIYSDSSCFASFSRCAAERCCFSCSLCGIDNSTCGNEARQICLSFFLVCLSKVVVCSQTKELYEVK